MNDSTSIMKQLSEISFSIIALTKNSENLNDNYSKVGERLCSLDENIHEIHEKIDDNVEWIGGKFEWIGEQFEWISEKFEWVGENFKWISEKFSEIDESIQDLKDRVTSIELTIENEIRPNIIRVAEGHLDLSRKLDDAIRVNSEREMFIVRLNTLEDEERRICKRVDHLEAVLETEV